MMTARKGGLFRGPAAACTWSVGSAARLKDLPRNARRVNRMQGNSGGGSDIAMLEREITVQGPTFDLFTWLGLALLHSPQHFETKRLPRHAWRRSVQATLAWDQPRHRSNVRFVHGRFSIIKFLRETSVKWFRALGSADVVFHPPRHACFRIGQRCVEGPVLGAAFPGHATFIEYSDERTNASARHSRFRRCRTR